MGLPTRVEGTCQMVFTLARRRPFATSDWAVAHRREQFSVRQRVDVIGHDAHGGPGVGVRRDRLRGRGTVLANEFENASADVGHPPTHTSHYFE